FHFDEAHGPRAGIAAQPFEIDRQASPLDLTRADHPSERVARSEAQKSEARRRLSLASRLANDVRHHDREGSVAAPKKNGSVTPLDQGARDVPPFFDAARDEEFARRQDLVERVDHF